MKSWNNKGFTLIEMLFAFSVFLLIAALLPLLFRMALSEESLNGRIQWMEWEVFINQLQREIQLSEEVYIANNQLLIHRDGELTWIQKYNQVLRRRVDMAGHEVMLQNVDSVQFKKGEKYVEIEVTDTFGRTNKRKVFSFTDGAGE